MILKLLDSFSPITLEEMDRVSLLKRTDTKFLTTENVLCELLELISSEYQILEIDNQRLMNYATLYFDTHDKKSYVEHHNGKANRYKIRMRKYIDSNLCFLEVKKKKNSGVTNKIRCNIDDFEEVLSAASKDFIKINTNIDVPLEKVMSNTFKRFTLINKKYSERVTIDTGICFSAGNKTKNLKKIAIIEVKQEKARISTDIYKALKVKRIRKISFSKYCIGISNLFTNIKLNQFKEVNLKIMK